MIKKTLWSPDTCGCVLEYEWDDSVPTEERTHTPTRATKICAEHTVEKVATREANLGIGRGKETREAHHIVYDAVLAENQGKNRVMAALVESDDFGETVKDDDDNDQRRFKRNAEPEWSFEPDTRKLKIKVKETLGAAKKLAVRTAIRQIVHDAEVE